MAFIYRGLYKHGIFRFTITLPECYPNVNVPSVSFLTPVFHPLVNAATYVSVLVLVRVCRGLVLLTDAFPTWDVEKHDLAVLVGYMYCQFV